MNEAVIDLIPSLPTLASHVEAVGVILLDKGKGSHVTMRVLQRALSSHDARG